MIRGFLIAIILLYRLIPCRIRRIWSFGYSTSHRGLEAVRGTSTSVEAMRVFLDFTVKPRWGDNDLNNTW